MVKKIITLILFMGLLVVPSYGDIVTYEAGVTGDPTMDDSVYEYSEYFFLTGEPILLTGLAEVESAPNNQDNYDLTFSFELSNADENIIVEREITYEVTNKKDDVMNQTIYKAEIDDIDEEITIDGTEYVLSSYNFDRSKLIDNTPAVDYYSGNVYFRRVYYINGDSVANEGKIVHEINSISDIGYDHHWGSSETLILEHTIDATVLSGGDNASWTGYVTTKNSSINKKRFKYNETEAQNISFRGSYVKNNTMENIVQCTYDLPTVNDGAVNESSRVRAEKNISKDVVTNYESLVSPKIRDIGGHWAEKEIFLLRSLGILNNSNEYFAPDSQMNRLMFGKAIANALTDLDALDLTDRVIRDRDREGNLFEDVDNDDPDYEYYRFLDERGIMTGFPNNLFYPYGEVTRAQAVQTMVNALGLETLAPSPPYRTVFKDDDAIGDWARDAVYVASEIGLLSGYPDGTFRPNQPLTKADGSMLLMNFIEHIKDNITVDYREKIINKY